MIISRTPLRITLGGGGTDIPSFYETHGEGFLVAAAIDKYIYVAVHDNFEPEYLLKYSAIEKSADLEAIKHPIIRECLRLYGVPASVEVSSIADIPAGTGLGSSGTFTVGMLRSLAGYRRQLVSNAELAAQACHIEIDTLREPVGKQDQYIAALGGLTSLTFRGDGTVEAQSVNMPQRAMEELQDNLLLFYTGVRRSASDELQELSDTVARPSSRMSANLTDVRQAGHLAQDLLQSGSLVEFASLLTDQWRLKFDRSPSRIHEEIDELIQAGLAAGAQGGKLVGAGGGGFLLFYAESKLRLREVMADRGLREVKFRFDFQGTTVL